MIDQRWYVRPPGVEERIGAGGVVVRAEGWRVLVALARPRGSSEFILPKGGIESDESPEEAARREILEEAGIDQLVLLRELGIRERLNFSRRRWTRTHYFLFSTDSRGGKPTDAKGRFEWAAWHAIDELPKMIWPEQRELIVANEGMIRSFLR